MPANAVTNTTQTTTVNSADVAAPAAATAAVVTYAAVAGKFHVLREIFVSIDVTSSSAVNIKVEDVAGTIVFSQDLVGTAGLTKITFAQAKQAQAVNTAMIITVSAPASGSTVKLTCTHDLITV